MRSTTILAPAKLNLYLELLGKRPDGYHELETVMVAINRFDRVRVTRTDHPDRTIACRWSPSLGAWQQQLRRVPTAATAAMPPSRVDVDPLLHLPSGRDNLAFRAAEQLCQATGWDGGFMIELEKTIPAGAGLGGASSDAAAVLRGLAALLPKPPQAVLLRELAAELGSDVPFFLGPPAHTDAAAPRQSAVALATGRGERLRFVPRRGALPLVVAFPPQSLSTARVYGNCTLPAKPLSPAPILSALAAGNQRRIAACQTNRLAKPARELAPFIHRLLQTMRAIGLHQPQMTGSGSACFAHAENPRVARWAARRLQARGFGVSFAATPCPLPTPLQ